MSSTLIIIPTYNEAENIQDLLRKLISLYNDIDILIIDDASPDGTSTKVKELIQKYPQILLIERHGKGGRGSAVLTGFRYALQHEYQHCIEMDADFSHRPEEIHLLLEKITTCDMVIGSRYLPGSKIYAWGIKRTIFSYLANTFARYMLGIPISDYTNGFRCYTRKAIQSLEIEHIDAKGYVVLSEVAMQLWKKKMRISEISTIFVNRRRGISNLTRKEISEAFVSVIRIYRAYRGKENR